MSAGVKMHLSVLVLGKRERAAINKEGTAAAGGLSGNVNHGWGAGFKMRTCSHKHTRPLFNYSVYSIQGFDFLLIPLSSCAKSHSVALGPAECVRTPCQGHNEASSTSQRTRVRSGVEIRPGWRPPLRHGFNLVGTQSTRASIPAR